MSRPVSVERISADILFARATSPENRGDAGARHLAEEPQRSSALLFLTAFIELACLALVMGALLMFTAVAVGAL